MKKEFEVTICCEYDSAKEFIVRVSGVNKYEAIFLATNKVKEEFEKVNNISIDDDSVSPYCMRIW